MVIQYANLIASTKTIPGIFIITHLATEQSDVMKESMSELKEESLNANLNIVKVGMPVMAVMGTSLSVSDPNDSRSIVSLSMSLMMSSLDDSPLPLHPDFGIESYDILRDLMDYYF